MSPGGFGILGKDLGSGGGGVSVLGFRILGGFRIPGGFRVLGQDIGSHGVLGVLVPGFRIPRELQGSCGRI